MAKQPSFDLWSKWFQITNMSSAEFRALADRGSSLSDDEITMLINMINTGNTFKEACAGWDGNCWAFCREQVSRNVFPGYDSSRSLRAEPSRDQLSLGDIESSKGDFFDIENARGDGAGIGGPKQGDGGAAICRCPKCGYWAVHKRGNPCNLIKCPKCGNLLIGE